MPRTMLASLLLAAAVLISSVGDVVRAADPAPTKKEQKHRTKIDEFFAGPIVRLEITFAPEELEKLRRDQRNYAEATVSEGGHLFEHVAIKLKGTAGSFQGVDQKPGMTLSFDKFEDTERFHGMKKFHLNNCAQDGTYLQEQIAGEIARAAGVPASRCTQAFVKLNGRDLGLYVVKEAFTKDFISTFFPHPTGDLWDGGFCKDLEENMEKDQGDPKDNAALKELIEACREGDAAKRWERVGRVLDIERFISFAVIEDFVCHWDGYNFNHNNYRVYRDVDSGKISFFAHGMDQTFGDANFPVVRDSGSMVTAAILKHPEGAKLYRARALQIYEQVLKAQDWAARVAANGAKVKTAWVAIDEGKGAEFEGRITDVRNRVTARIQSVGAQLGDAPKPREFDENNTLKLTGGWHTEGNFGDGGNGAEVPVDGLATMQIHAGPGCTASWRRIVPLPPGRYRFEVQTRTAGVVATADEKGRGAQVRISGGVAQQSAEGDTPWKTLAYDFTVSSGAVVLVAELRAQAGDAWFESPRLIWQPSK
jgi:hypothetical protein